ncbi:16S rRNA (uracil(1498)-N(3))-methyltransferase [Anoxybacillus rupiensis]|uniref:Ribosomal RNA small subunit methyltransferase E n=1 Tax=Anoxybacteroides rupiense TaxID=311460 RepID=A0ABT5VZZ2_9BACL|nr:MULTISPECIES: 16S rRNA (uracil(1498)-N(3))-methyltransferase [Anoxybacillus]KXG11332.1 Ribosomal RNA small subunit methyltransferase E [Anoxybacillus sp. P3H1B]MBB3906910.1 16S rRNA (uracil1498-N3)-methyltransferase [Anoxybacillus rupiensis]MBS2769980.1 16S rRNA (uracil(1498)-N(3))-methyltransferase [Anoxybacillus rupiensis]MDE8562648.1 16S rRNA (uracil(1498)-N(3))-methyltransferase [Anoxybacillus rupiensis]
MQRYFVSKDQIHHDQIVMTGDDYHHMVRVMRMREGDAVICCNENGKAALCEIVRISSENMMLRIIKWIEEQTELPIRIYIAHGLPKGDKFELVIQKGTELGAFAFIPFLAARSVVKWEAKKADKKLERWRKIAKEAAEQAHRTRIPDIYQPMSMEPFIEFARTLDYRMVAYEEEAKQGEAAALRKVLRQMKPGQSMLVLFGPEGGLAEHEITKLQENGFFTCGLGPRILRTETAPLYVLAAASYEWELR